MNNKEVQMKMEKRNMIGTQLKLDIDSAMEIEKRSFITTFEKREGAGRTIYGYAAVYNQETDMGWYIEKIAPGAFDEAIKRSDVRALFNHDPSALLARQSSGTLQLSVDEKGLKYEFNAPYTSWGNDILELIARGDLKESSFAFTVEEQEWREIEQDGKVQYYRTIKKVKELFDVSPVTYAAYDTTSVAKRSFEQFKQEQVIVNVFDKKEKNQDKFLKQRSASALAVLYS